jgi:DNA-binding NarL/FixJ family response regulator
MGYAAARMYVSVPGARRLPTTIVLVDDDQDFRLIARALLGSLSDAVTIVGEADDGETALALVRHRRPDIVITDLVMPHLNGVELTRRIREELPETQVILVSSYTEDAYLHMASDSGADAFVNKHVITSSLVPAVRDLIRRRLSGGSDPPPPGGGASSSYVPPK